MDNAIQAKKPLYDAKQKTLKNGLVVIAIKNTLSPIATVGVLYKVGTADDPSDLKGVSHFLEHMLFTGTKRFPGTQFQDGILAYGGQINAHTTPDHTFYENIVPLEYLEDILDKEADRMVNLSYQKEKVLSEREVVLQERLSRYENSPFGQARELMLRSQHLYHPYGVLSIGYRHHIMAYTAENTYAWYKQWYAPNNAILIVSGNIEHEKVFTLAEKYFGPLKISKSIPEKRIRPQDPDMPNTTQYVIHEAPRSAVVQVVLNYKAPCINTAKNRREVQAYNIAAYMLGGTEVSLFYDKLIVEKKQVATSISFGYENSYDPWPLSVSVELTTDMSIAKFMDEYNAYSQEVLDNLNTPWFIEKFENAKKQLVGMLKFASDGTYGQVMSFLGLSEGFTFEDVQESEDRINEVTHDDIKKAIREVLGSKPYSVLIVTPPKYKVDILGY